MQEYGGYLPLELRHSGEYYGGKDCVALNAGRYAIRYAVRDARLRRPVKKLWPPYYFCPAVEQAPREEPVEIGRYHIGRDLLPADYSSERAEYLLRSLEYVANAACGRNRANEQELDRAGMRVAHHIYAARLWKEVSADPQADTWEKEQAETVCILPVDQRYPEAEMQAAAVLAEQFLTKGTEGKVLS